MEALLRDTEVNTQSSDRSVQSAGLDCIMARARLLDTARQGLTIVKLNLVGKMLRNKIAFDSILF